MNESHGAAPAPRGDPALEQYRRIDRFPTSEILLVFSLFPVFQGVGPLFWRPDGELVTMYVAAGLALACLGFFGLAMRGRMSERNTMFLAWIIIAGVPALFFTVTMGQLEA